MLPKAMLALSIRRTRKPVPGAELIVREETTIEYRSKPTKLIGTGFWV